MRTGSLCPQAGFTYVGVLLLVAGVGLALSATSTVWHFEVQREKEKELLFIGNEFRTALDRYATAQVQTAGKRFPSRLEDLLQDNRTLARVRHLRRIYRDPMTGKDEWGLVKTGDGQIIGVHSLSQDEPIKKANFGDRDSGLAGRSHYDQWVFLAATAPAAMTSGSRLIGGMVGRSQQSR